MSEGMLPASDEDIARASRSLKAMSHPLRLKILCTLGGDEVSVQDIVEHVGTSQSNISQHLAILRDKGILSSRKDANRVYYRVRARFRAPIAQWLRSMKPERASRSRGH